jgi:isopentenyldiphosphate isomerase/intracellular septation protein A
MLPGLLPLLIFIIVDAIWGTEAGLVVAIIFGFGELVIILLKERRFDWFVIFDTGLLILLGVISLISSDEIFFKLKPAFINVIFLVIIGLSAFSNKNLLLLYSKRYLKDLEINESHQAELRTTFQVMFWLFFINTALIVYSAFYMSKAAWGFISGALLYIMFGVYFGWQFLMSKRNQKKEHNEEWFPLVDEKGNVIGKTTRENAHSRPGILHPVVHLHIFNMRGEIYLQKRPSNKDIQPGKWDTAVGGHVNLGETVEQALLREAKEELGIENFRFSPFMNYRWDSARESELVYSFIAQVNSHIKPNTLELADGRFWTIDELRQLVGKNILTPNFEHEFSYFQNSKFKNK